MVAGVHVGVGLGEGRHDLRELLVLAEVGRDGDAVAGAGVRPRQGPGADLAVEAEVLGGHVLDGDRALPVVQLPDVEVADRSVEAHVALPAEEHVAGRLHDPLAGDDPHALVPLLGQAEVH